MNISMQDIITELHRAFAYLNKDLSQNSLEEPIIVVQTKGREDKMGWCSKNKIWGQRFKLNCTKYEVSISAEYLGCGYNETMNTLTHEMVHLYNAQNGISDTSRNGTYHNKKFKIEAERVGLNVDYDKRYGWACTDLSEELERKINFYNINKDVFSISRLSKDVFIREALNPETDPYKELWEMVKEEKKRRGEIEEKTSGNEVIKTIKRKSGYYKYICPSCHITIRATKMVNVVCQDCNKIFQIEE